MTIGLKGNFGVTENNLINEPHLDFLESKVRFSFRLCNFKEKKYCIRELEDNEIEKFYKRLAHFEGMTWRAAIQMPREKGFSQEKKNDSNFRFLHDKFSNFSTFYHFRVNGTNNPFRVFAGQENDMCCVLLLDRNGLINH